MQLLPAGCFSQTLWSRRRELAGPYFFLPFSAGSRGSHAVFARRTLLPITPPQTLLRPAYLRPALVASNTGRGRVVGPDVAPPSNPPTQTAACNTDVWELQLKGWGGVMRFGAPQRARRNPCRPRANRHPKRARDPAAPAQRRATATQQHYTVSTESPRPTPRGLILAPFTTA
ncbi:hypothetical protein DFH07DRAFT_767777 [Mycena maculata]|uniref:Uncharacterized protein n=1 Tax=Mycena maculata TaxID=230809 RepID=A0AAD7JY32_9AGAR|nr:hypothetical protein DFH07DRAFT_767777 [Mycena maculata]